MRLTILVPRRAQVTIPLTRAGPAGTLAVVIKDAATHLGISVDDVLAKIR